MTVVTDWAYCGFCVSKWKQFLDIFMFLQNKGAINQGSLKCIGGCSRGVVKNHGGPFAMGLLMLSDGVLSFRLMETRNLLIS